jgi:hypothetical protein
MAEDRFANGSKTHIHRQGDFTSSAPGPSLDFGNGYFGHVPEPLANRLRKPKAARIGDHLGSVSNPAQARVGYKELRKRALEDHNPDPLVGLQFPAQFVEFLRQNFIKKIDRRMIDADECDSRIKPEPETFVIRILHERSMFSDFGNYGVSHLPEAFDLCDEGLPSPQPAMRSASKSNASRRSGTDDVASLERRNR